MSEGDIPVHGTLTNISRAYLKKMEEQYTRALFQPLWRGGPRPYGPPLPSAMIGDVWLRWGWDDDRLLIDVNDGVEGGSYSLDEEATRLLVRAILHLTPTKWKHPTWTITQPTRCDFADDERVGAEATADFCYEHQDFCMDQPGYVEGGWRL